MLADKYQKCFNHHVLYVFMGEYESKFNYYFSWGSLKIPGNCN